ncbi:MAG TPA: serine/threonine-protein kinase [Candidatus Obscuribacterales bacterium]
MVVFSSSSYKDNTRTTMAKTGKKVCFQTKNGLVSFIAKHTSSPCDASKIYEKKMGSQEKQTHKAIGYHKRIPNLAGSVGNKGIMPRAGQALRDIPGRRGQLGGKLLVRTKQAQLRKDLTKAISHLHSKGIKHMDLREGASRNILWDGKHFNVIDFGKVQHTSDYNVGQEVDHIMNSLSLWAVS